MRIDKLSLAIVSLLLIYSLAGCKEQKSDDPIKSFELRSGQKPVDNIKVLNGRYWQSAHWSKEYILYLEVQPSAGWRKEFLNHNKLILSGERNYPNDAPAWFKPIGNYRVWKASAFDQGSRYFEDTLSGHMYLYEIQL